MPEEHDVVEILELYEVNRVGDMRSEVDFGACEVHPLAKPGEGDGVGVVAVISQATGDPLPTLASQPSATY